MFTHHLQKKPNWFEDKDDITFKFLKLNFLAVPCSGNLYSLVDSSAGALFSNRGRHSKILNEIANLYFSFVVLIKTSLLSLFIQKMSPQWVHHALTTVPGTQGPAAVSAVTIQGRVPCASTPTGLRAHPENGYLLAIVPHPLSDVSLWGGELNSG